MVSFSRNDWNQYAECYDAITKLTPHLQMQKDIVDVVARFGSNTLLDVGCGTGNLLLSFSMRQTGRIVGIDSSTSMINIARKKCRGQNVGLYKADINQTLPFPQKFFSTITCVNVLYTAKHTLKTLSELYRILKPSGVLVIATPKTGYENGLILKKHCGSRKPDKYWLNMHRSKEHEEMIIREAIPNEETYEQLLRIADFNRRISHTTNFSFFTKEKLRSLVYAAGFNIVMHTYTYAKQSHLLVATRY